MELNNQHFPTPTADQWKRQAKGVFAEDGTLPLEGPWAPLYWTRPGDWGAALPVGPPWRLFQTLEGVAATDLSARATEALEGGAQGLVFPCGEWDNEEAALEAVCGALGEHGGSVRLCGIKGGRARSLACAQAVLNQCRRASKRISVFVDFDEALWPQGGEGLGEVRFFLADTRGKTFGSYEEELAFCLLEIVERLRKRAEMGEDPRPLLRCGSVMVTVGATLFGPVIKLRALRRVLQRLAEGFGEEGYGGDLHVETDRALCCDDGSYHAVVPMTAAVWAAILGGAHHITALPLLPQGRGMVTEEALRLSRTMPLVFQKEAGLYGGSDPARGAYFFETETEKLAQASWALFQKSL